MSKIMDMEVPQLSGAEADAFGKRMEDVFVNVFRDANLDKRIDSVRNLLGILEEVQAMVKERG